MLISIVLHFGTLVNPFKSWGQIPLYEHHTKGEKSG
jgi:hypothetical protein